MKKDAKVLIGHIIESTELIEQYSQDLTEEKFKNNVCIQDSIVRRLEIIGEAVKNIPTAFKTNHPDLPWKQMAGMRDVLIHEYFAIDLSLTWMVVKRELLPIKTRLQILLTEVF